MGCVEIKQRATRVLLERGGKEQREPSNYTMGRKSGTDGAPSILIAFSSLLALGAYVQGLLLVASAMIGYTALAVKLLPTSLILRILCGWLVWSPFRLH
jgi:hypothetical protein